MGEKGTSMNVSDISATYVVLRGLTDKIREHCADIEMHKKAIIAEFDQGSVDSDSSEALEANVKELDRICDSINATLAEVQMRLDAGIRKANELASRANARASSVNEDLKSSGRSFKR